LSRFLFCWTRGYDYLATLERGTRRVNLDGSDAGSTFRPEGAAV
jgi:hypothetical protein